MSNPKELMFKYKAGCLTVTAAGRFVIEHKETAVKSIAEAIKAQPVKAALVDLREVADPITFMDRYLLGQLAGRYLTQVPIAVLALESQIDKQQIGKLVANNRGANVEVLTNPVAARTWLNKHQRPDS